MARTHDQPEGGDALGPLHQSLCMSFISWGHVLQGEKHTLLLFAKLRFKLISNILVYNCFLMHLWKLFTFGTGSQWNFISVMCAILKQYIKFLQCIDMVQKLQFYVIDFNYLLAFSPPVCSRFTRTTILAFFWAFQAWKHRNRVINFYWALQVDLIPISKLIYTAKGGIILNF